MYSDFTAINDVEYCYTVRALHDEGESPPSNEDCAMWSIYPPSNVIADAGDGYVDLSWGMPDPNTDADLVGIPLQIICGNSFKENREISILKRANKDQINIAVGNAVDKIIKMIGCNE